MSLDEHRKAWSEIGSGPEGLPDGEELLERVKASSEAFDRRIRRRDLREIGAAVFVVLAFGYEAVTAASTLTRAGAAIVIAGALLVIWKLRRARPDPEPEAEGRPVADRLRRSLGDVERQLELHETVLWWYLAPLVAGSVLFVAGLGSALWATALTLTLIGVVSVWVLRINRRLVRNDLRPRRERLAALLRELEGA
ncbi:MAG TPA: hypothetical protein VKB18_11265 [Gemmatimonadota bacterium]|nr:hypothetical protein [Gemmatimonadota bacterium]